MENPGGSTVIESARDQFISESSTQSFLATLEDMLLNTTTRPMVKERMLDVLGAVAYSRAGGNEHVITVIHPIASKE